MSKKVYSKPTITVVVMSTSHLLAAYQVANTTGPNQVWWFTQQVDSLTTSPNCQRSMDRDGTQPSSPYTISPQIAQG